MTPKRPKNNPSIPFVNEAHVVFVRRRHSLLEFRRQVRCGSHLLDRKSCLSVLHLFPGCHLLSPHRLSGTTSLDRYNHLLSTGSFSVATLSSVFVF